ncbi:hypothetical protein JNW88_20425 [Micromonospora sp. ATA32]|nr:hypothetical protein [Micromonospora sp. ATA32]
MSDEYLDPSGNTAQFRAFAHSPRDGRPPAQPRVPGLPLMIGASGPGTTTGRPAPPPPPGSTCGARPGRAVRVDLFRYRLRHV